MKVFLSEARRNGGSIVRLLLAALLVASIATVILACGGIEPADASTISPATREGAWATNGTVNTILPADDVTYIGGTFDYLGPDNGHAALLDAADGTLKGDFPYVDGYVYASIPDGEGGWYIAGDFTSVGGQERNRIAHIAADGSVSSFNPGADNRVCALALSETTLFLGGWFDYLGGQARSKMAAVDIATGDLTGWNPDVDRSVTTLALSGGTLYAGGYFTSFSGQTRNKLAAVDIASGNLTEWNPDVSNGGGVDAIAISGNTLYAGGALYSVGGQPRTSIAAIDTTTGIVTTWNPDVTGHVYALALSGDTLFAGGSISQVNGVARTGIAAIDTATGDLNAWDPGAIDGYVYDLELSGTRLFAGGQISSIAGQAQRNMTALDAVTGDIVGFEMSSNNTVHSLSLSGTSLLVGGWFTSIGGRTRNHLAAIDNSTGFPTAWNPDVNGEVSALAVSGDVLYAAGDFTSVGAESRTGLAAIETVTGNPATWSPNTQGASIYAIAVSGSTLYAGGYFTSIGGLARSNLAAIDMTTGALTPWNPDVDSSVAALAVSGTTLYAGGSFSSVDGQARVALASFDIVSGSLTAWAPAVDLVLTNEKFIFYAAVHDVIVIDGIVYIGGTFNRIGWQTRNNAAAIDGAGNPTAWNPDVNRNVNAFAYSGSKLFLGGGFSSVGGQVRNCLAAVDLATGAVTDWDPMIDDSAPTVMALGCSDRSLYAGGWFSSVGGQACRNLAVFAREYTGPEIASVNPSSVTNNGITNLTLNGEDFLEGATVTLKKSGSPDIIAATIMVTSDENLTCSVDMTDAATGAWDVVISNPDGLSGQLPGGLNVNFLLSCGSGSTGTLLALGMMLGLLSLGRFNKGRRKSR